MALFPGTQLSISAPFSARPRRPVLCRKSKHLYGCCGRPAVRRAFSSGHTFPRAVRGNSSSHHPSGTPYRASTSSARVSIALGRLQSASIRMRNMSSNFQAGSTRSEECYGILQGTCANTAPASRLCSVPAPSGEPLKPASRWFNLSRVSGVAGLGLPTQAQTTPATPQRPPLRSEEE